MKIEIDLQDILGDEYGDMESLAQSIERQLVSHLKDNLAKKIQERIDSEVADIISSKVSEAADKIVPTLMTELVDKEYTPVGDYGRKREPTTMRNELLKTLVSQMVYKPARYDSDKNYFTKSIDVLVREQIAIFKKDFEGKVNETLTKEAFDYAITKMYQKFKMAE
jgi:hypothetical protein